MEPGRFFIRRNDAKMKEELNSEKECKLTHRYFFLQRSVNWLSRIKRILQFYKVLVSLLTWQLILTVKLRSLQLARKIFFLKYVSRIIKMLKEKFFPKDSTYQKPSKTYNNDFDFQSFLN